MAGVAGVIDLFRYLDRVAGDGMAAMVARDTLIVVQRGEQFEAGMGPWTVAPAGA